MKHKLGKVTFRVEGVLRELSIGVLDPIQLTSKDGKFTLRVWEVACDDPDYHYSNDLARASMTADFEVTSDVLGELELIAEGKMSSIFEISTDTFGHVRRSGFESYLRHEKASIVGRGLLPSVFAMSKDLQDFFTSAIEEIDSALYWLIDLLRWRLRIEGPRQPFEKRSAEWTLDSIKWSLMPSVTNLKCSITHLPRVNESLVDEIAELAKLQVRAPIAHSLLREARAHVDENPRSALVQAVAAAEIGVEAFIADLVSDASYLVEKTIVSNLDDLLVNYLPSLPVRNRIKGAVHALPKRCRVRIKEAVETRNRLVHRPMGAFEAERNLSSREIDELFEAIEDLLWLLDFYCGHDWAIHYISDTTLQDLSLDVEYGVDDGSCIVSY